MSYLMRMISPMKEWIQEPNEIINDGMISADAISDLRTTCNCISTWYVGNKSEEEIKKAVLALTSGFRSLEDIKIAFLDDVKIKAAGLSVHETDGETKIKEYVKLHRDIAHLNSEKLQKLAKIVLESIWEENTTTVHRETIILWLLSALNEKKLKFEDLDKNLRQCFAASVNKLIRSKKVKKNTIDNEVWKSIAEQTEKNSRKTTCQFEGECERYKKVS